jgi:hypothetical protein
LRIRRAFFALAALLIGGQGRLMPLQAKGRPGKGLGAPHGYARKFALCQSKKSLLRILQFISLPFLKLGFKRISLSDRPEIKLRF